MTERLEVQRQIPASPADVFAVLSDPQGHVAIDASGMLMDADGDRVSAVGDRFVVHMDRESLGDIPEMGKYDVTVIIETFEPDREISWSISGVIQPPVGHIYGYRLEPRDGGTLATSFYDWSTARQDIKDRDIFPVVSESALSGTLGILDRTVRRGYPNATPR